MGITLLRSAVYENLYLGGRMMCSLLFALSLYFAVSERGADTMRPAMTRLANV